jgi:hypothetical protein
MGDTPWKVHERVVARYFGVERQKRGDDFGVSDCDVLAPEAKYAAARGRESVLMQAGTALATHIVVECKRHKGLKLHEWMRKHSQSCRGEIPILIWNEFRASWMEDRKRRVFDEVYDDLVFGLPRPVEYLLQKYRFGYINRATPKYLTEWYEQAVDYSHHFGTQYAKDNPNANYVYALPLVAVAQKGMQGRVIVWKAPREVTR